MSDDRTKADKAWEARQEAARYRIFWKLRTVPRPRWQGYYYR